MRRYIVVFIVMAASALWFSGFSWGQCPADPNDKGVCDTLYVEPYKYSCFPSFPANVEVAMYITHDVPADSTDSLAGIVIPLCFTSSNAAANATIYPDSNKCGSQDLISALHNLLFDLNKSVFRHLPSMEDPQVHNWMLDESDLGGGQEWDTRILDLTQPNAFWSSMIVLGSQDQRVGDVSKVLWLTMTITIEDTTTICIDSCFWPPTARLAFTNDDASYYVPRHNLPFCFLAGYCNDVREVQDSEESRPTEFSLSQNYPNPFNPTTNIKFELPKTAHVRLDVFNIVGQKVKTLVDQNMNAGKYVADWDGKDEKGNSVSSGIYFYRMDAGDFSDIKKMLLVK
jgi:hypothetical protein